MVSVAMSALATFHVPTERQGQTGRGQGGFTAYQFVRSIGQPVTVALRSAIPLEAELSVMAFDQDQWQLVDPTSPEIVIMEATLWDRHFADTDPVTISQAEAARAGFPVSAETHPAPHCLSCGLSEASLSVHAGPMSDGRWATPLRLPREPDGGVDLSLAWMAMDCACGWYISHSTPDSRQSLTVQFAVEVHTELEADTDYALVAWHGDYAPGWDGRKRGAAAALFDAAGNCVAQCRSFWVAPRA